MSADSGVGGRNCHGELGKALVVCVCMCACMKESLWRKGWERWLCVRHRSEWGGSMGLHKGVHGDDHDCASVSMGEGL